MEIGKKVRKGLEKDREPAISAEGYDSIRVPLMSLSFYRSESRWEPDPSNEVSPVINVEDGLPGFDKKLVVDLHSLDVGAIVYFTCTNSHAFYTLRIEPNGKVKIWRDWSGITTGLIGRIDDLVVWDQKTYDEKVGEVTAYPGILFSRESCIKQPRLSMPYFDYDNENRVIKPNDAWTDFITQIYLKNPA